MEWISLSEHFVITLLTIFLCHRWYQNGWRGVYKCMVQFLRGLPFVDLIVNKFLHREVINFLVEQEAIKRDDVRQLMPIPEKGDTAEELLDGLQGFRDSEKNLDGRLFAYVYTGLVKFLPDLGPLQKTVDRLYHDSTEVPGEENLQHVIRAYHEAYLHDNALNPMLFKSLRKFEVELVQMTAQMLSGDGHVVGHVTSGGTESILMAVKCYRDRARCQGRLKNPEMIAPQTAHPAFEKAAHYFNVKMVRVPVDHITKLPNPADIEKAVTSRTILLVASAPQYCHGVIDPIQDMAKIAKHHNLGLHVDACFGGFMLPWVERLGYSVPLFDFRVSGVTSISADLHKYGYTPKGASVLLYKNSEIRKHQIFAYSEWPGGLFGSPSMAGSRPGANLASAWATVRYMGKERYVKLAKEMMILTRKWIQAITEEIDGLMVLGRPVMTSFAVASSDSNLNIYTVADKMEERGWKMERQQECLHVSVMPHHITGGEEFTKDLSDVVKSLKNVSNKKIVGSAAVYGMMAKIPDTQILDNFLIDIFDQLYK